MRSSIANRSAEQSIGVNPAPEQRSHSTGSSITRSNKTRWPEHFLHITKRESISPSRSSIGGEITSGKQQSRINGRVNPFSLEEDLDAKADSLSPHSEQNRERRDRNPLARALRDFEQNATSISLESRDFHRDRPSTKVQRASPRPSTVTSQVRRIAPARLSLIKRRFTNI